MSDFALETVSSSTASLLWLLPNERVVDADRVSLDTCDPAVSAGIATDPLVWENGGEPFSPKSPVEFASEVED